MKDNQQLYEEIIEEFVTIKRKDPLSPDEVISIVLNAGISENQMHSILIESTHQHTNRIFSRSNYYVKNLNSPAHKTKLQRGLAQYNAYNV